MPRGDGLEEPFSSERISKKNGEELKPFHFFYILKGVEVAQERSQKSCFLIIDGEKLIIDGEKLIIDGEKLIIDGGKIPLKPLWIKGSSTPIVMYSIY